MNDSDTKRVFDTDPLRYEVLVNWERRLANEGPFYRRLFDEAGVQRVLDVACGTGHHAELFNSWSLQVEGADASDAMISHCRDRLGESEKLKWVIRSFQEPCERPGSFDAVICVGNSLALSPDVETALTAVREMMAALRPGGVCVVHVLNLWRFAEGEMHWQKCLRVNDERGDRIVLKGVYRVGSRGFVEFVEVRPDGAGQFDSSTILALDAEALVEAAASAGAHEVELYGGYQGEPYDRATSADMILVAYRDK
jgi:SAM-dependent methyltransferase